MKFKDIPVGTKFTRPNANATFTKVPEQRVRCCKVKCNATRDSDNAKVVLRPMDEVNKVEK